MKTVEASAAQGDVMFMLVDELPEGLTLQPTEAGRVIVAHSETGHHHVAVAEDLQLFGTIDPLVTYLASDSDHIDIVHERSFDTHEGLRLVASKKGKTERKGKKSVWKVSRQREAAPGGWSKVAD